jgi:ABC-type lipoprotein release transport system permease subunit
MVAVTAALGLVALVACLLSARRVTTLGPVSALSGV